MTQQWSPQNPTAPQPTFTTTPISAPQRTEPLVFWALGYAVVSIVCWFIAPAFAIATARAALRNIEASNGQRGGKGFAIAAIALSVASLTISVLILILVFLASSGN